MSHTSSMVLEPLGESALILRDLPLKSNVAACCIEAAELPCVVDVICSYDTVGIYFEGTAPTLHEIEASFTNIDYLPEPSHHVIPVCYDLGEDLESAASFLGLSSEAIIGLHTSVEYRCFAVGFCPGFPYLGDLPEALRGVPRHAQPRVRVEPGSVAITGKQTGIYPLLRPGGWSLLGRTPLEIVNVEDEYFPIRAGDKVSFRAISPGDFHALKGHRL